MEKPESVNREKTDLLKITTYFGIIEDGRITLI